MTNIIPDIIVVGAGAAGLLAAVRAAELGANVLVLEHKSKPARKLAITGKGQCNLTNTAELSTFLNHFHPNGRFLRTAFSHFFVDELIAFFNDIGVPTVEERGGRVFPKSKNALELVDSLVNWALKKGIEIVTNQAVSGLMVNNGIIEGVQHCQVKHQKGSVIKITETNVVSQCKAVILATGGASYPGTGSTGDGYKLAESVNHSIITPRPALVPIVLENEHLSILNGLQLKNVSASVWSDQKKVCDEFGELTFTDYGLTGPIILTLSHRIVASIDKHSSVQIKLDLKPALDHKKMDNRLLRELQNNHKKQLQSILKELLPKQMIPFCLITCGINGEKKAHEISAEERKKLRMWLKELTFKVSGYRSFKEAIVTSGGISLKEINSKTMESKLVKGLFFAGEVMDIQADTGGYNLQAAFSTGRLAGESAFAQCMTK